MGSPERDIALVRRHYDAYNRDDIDGMVAALHANVEIVTYDEHGNPERRMSGRTAARGLFVEIKALAADTRVEVLSLEARPGRIEASLRFHGRLRSTGKAASVSATHVIEVRGDRITRIETFRPEWRS